MCSDDRVTTSKNRKRIFVVHGRNSSMRRAIFNSLKALGLEPLDWNSLRKMTGRGTPFTLDVVRKGMCSAWATVVLWNPEERVRLLPAFWGANTRKTDQEYTNQPRPNVILEAGMALSLMSDKVIFVRCGEVRPISDLEGLNEIRSADDVVDIDSLANTLSSIGCEVELKEDARTLAASFRKARTLPRNKVPLVLQEKCKAPCYGVWFAYQHDFHRAGDAIKDESATESWAWLCTSDIGHAVYGPYHLLPKGNYEAWFRVHVKKGNALLEVFDQDKNIQELNISFGAGYEIHGLPFILRSASLIEFRVSQTPGTVTAIDFTAVTRLP